MKNHGLGTVQKENVRRFKKILVAFDGSEYSIRALRAAAILAKAQGSELLVLYVIRPLLYSYAGMSNVAIQRIGRIEKEEAEAILKRGSELLREENIEAKVNVVEGVRSAVQAITEYADKESVDLIAVGTRGMSGFKKLFLGSVSSGVVAHAPCSVLVVR